MFGGLLLFFVCSFIHRLIHVQFNFTCFNSALVLLLLLPCLALFQLHYLWVDIHWLCRDQNLQSQSSRSYEITRKKKSKNRTRLRKCVALQIKFARKFINFYVCIFKIRIDKIRYKFFLFYRPHKIESDSSGRSSCFSGRFKSSEQQSFCGQSRGIGPFGLTRVNFLCGFGFYLK